MRNFAINCLWLAGIQGFLLAASIPVPGRSLASQLRHKLIVGALGAAAGVGAMLLVLPLAAFTAALFALLLIACLATLVPIGLFFYGSYVGTKAAIVGIVQLGR